MKYCIIAWLNWIYSDLWKQKKETNPREDGANLDGLCPVAADDDDGDYDDDSGVHHHQFMKRQCSHILTAMLFSLLLQNGIWSKLISRN
jgi:hypothetical protein